MKFIKTPYLPENNVTLGIAGKEIEKYTTELNRLGIDVLLTQEETAVPKPVRFHADLCVNYIGSGEVLLTKAQVKLKTTLEKLGCKCYPIYETLGNAYPEDCRLNCVCNQSDLICNYSIVSDKIKELCKGKNIINTRQGYTKCSLCPVADGAFITDDKSIAVALKNAKYDVLEVEKGSVALDGYDYGFIGGACSKISKNVLAFFGNAKEHKSYEYIKAFCGNYKIDLLSLDSGRLYDIGSFIPIFENDKLYKAER